MGQEVINELGGSVVVTPLKKIDNPKGNILHGLKNSDASYDGFGEAYFSTVNSGAVKGWKKHHKMKMNLLVPVGSVVFYLRDDDANLYSIRIVSVV